jgi:hypothetical protein
MAMTTKPNRSEVRTGDVTPGPAAADPTVVGGRSLRELPGWDEERGGIVHRDSGEQALELVKAAAARRRTAED